MDLNGWLPAGAGPARLPQLGPAAALRHLALAGPIIPPPGPAWDCLSTLGCLTRLELHRVDGNEWPAAMSCLAALQQLQLEDMRWGIGSWQPLAGLRQLTRMELSMPGHVHAEVHGTSSGNCPPALLHLHLTLDDASDLPPAIARHTALTHLVRVQLQQSASTTPLSRFTCCRY